VRAVRNKVVANEREGKTIIYGVPDRKLMSLLTEVFLRVEGISK